MENNTTNVSANFRSSRPKVFYRKGVLRPETWDFIKKETLAQLLSCEFCEISKKTFFTEHHWSLLLKIYQILHRISAVELISNKLSVSKQHSVRALI